MDLVDRTTARVLFTTLLFALAIGFLWLAWRVVLAFLFAILFAYLWEPVIQRLERRPHITRGRAVLIVYLGIATAVIVFLLFVSPNLMRQAGHLAGDLPSLESSVTSGQIAHQIGRRQGWSWQTQQSLQQFLAHHKEAINTIESRTVVDIGIAAGYLPWFVLVPILAIFFMLNGEKMQQALLRRIALHQRGLAAGLLADVHQVLAYYIRAQIILTGIALCAYLGGFLIMRVPYAVALGVGAGLLEFIPVVGPLTAGIIVMVTAFLLTYPHMLLLLGFLLVWRGMQDYFNSPRIMGNQVQLAPLAVLFGVLAGGEVAGVLGVFLSVPVMASLRVAWRRWNAWRTMG